MSTKAEGRQSVDVVRLHRGDAPLIVSMPHVGTVIPASIADAMTPIARHVPDTDWHVERLYDMAPDMGVTMIEATHSRYVIDLNRDPDNKPLYPGADNTELCPTSTFDLVPIYLPGQEPDQAEISRRIETYWQPYHRTLAAEISRLREKHEQIVLWDGHSIRSVLPRFFENQLPDINLGTGNCTSADAELARRVVETAEAANAYTTAFNGRFKGGHITRTYGAPAQGVHTIQLELSQVTYMEEALPFRYLPEKANEAKVVIGRMLTSVLDWLNET
jgi:N-formylglutamate deformylase